MSRKHVYVDHAEQTWKFINLCTVVGSGPVYQKSTDNFSACMYQMRLFRIGARFLLFLRNHIVHLAKD